jgi:hypothetical protein
MLLSCLGGARGTFNYNHLRRLTHHKQCQILLLLVSIITLSFFFLISIFCFTYIPTLIISFLHIMLLKTGLVTAAKYGHSDGFFHTITWLKLTLQFRVQFLSIQLYRMLILFPHLQLQKIIPFKTKTRIHLYLLLLPLPMTNSLMDF